MNEGLQRKGFDVVAAASVAEALRSIITESFDVRYIRRWGCGSHHPARPNVPR